MRWIRENKNKLGRRKSIKEIDQRPNRSSGSVSHARPSSSSAMTIDGVRQLWTASYEVHGRSNDRLVQVLASANMRLAFSMVCCLREGQGNAAACLQISPRQRRYPAESRAGQPLAKRRCDRPRRSWPLETLAGAATLISEIVVALPSISATDPKQLRSANRPRRHSESMQSRSAIERSRRDQILRGDAVRPQE
jgi:hypothetical protein